MYSSTEKMELDGNASLNKSVGVEDSVIHEGIEFHGGYIMVAQAFELGEVLRPKRSSLDRKGFLVTSINTFLSVASIRRAPNIIGVAWVIFSLGGIDR